MSSGDRFSVEDHSSPSRRKSYGAGWIFGIAGCLLMVIASPFLAVCGCCGGMAYLGVSEHAKTIAAAVKHDETFITEIGADATCWKNWAASNKAGDDVIVFDVSGDQGEGQLFVYRDRSKTQKIVLHKGDEQWELEFDSTELNPPTTGELLTTAIVGDKTIESEIGEIQYCDLDLDNLTDDPNFEVFNYEIVGDKGAGKIEAKFDARDRLIWAKLIKDGQTFDLELSSDSPKAN